MSTQLLCLDNMFLYETETTIKKPTTDAKGRPALVLDSTIFYPQGGGQPYDKGYIKTQNASFRVDEVRKENGEILHIGAFEAGALEKGQQAHCYVDKDRRILMSRLHSAGHVIDAAAIRLNIDLEPAKGYHYADGPYVQYETKKQITDMEKTRIALEEMCKTIIAEDIPTEILTMSKNEAKVCCKYVPAEFPDNMPIRIERWGAFSIPCGGTHVKSTGEVGSVRIRAVKQNGNTIKIAYAL